MRNTLLSFIATAGLAFTTSLAAPSTTHAQPDDGWTPHGYLGGGIGYYRVEDEQFPDDSDNFEDEREAYRVFVGGMVNPYFGIEGGYTNFAEASDGPVKVDTDGLSLAALGQIPLGRVLSIYGKGGLFAWDTDVRGPLGRASADGEDPFYGVGARIGLGTPLGLRLEYERFELDGTDVDLASVNLEFRF
jgi:hypothetical protein